MNIGIDIGGSHINIAVINEENMIYFQQEHIWTKKEKQDFFDSIIKCIKKAIYEILDKCYKIEKIGIGYPSKNILNGIIYDGDRKINIPKILEKEFNIPTFIKNDVKCAGICEKRIGNIKEYDNCIFITLGTGIGGAYFYKNELVIPNTYQGFEVGHMVIEKNGRLCRCGKKGCFEEYASMRVFREEIKEIFNLNEMNSHIMFELLEKGEKIDEINKVVDEYVNNLSIGLSNLISIFEPDAICIGGSFSHYSTIFMDKLIEKLKQEFPNREIPKILISKFKNDSGVIGASMLENN